MLLERGLDDAALHALAAAVNQPHLSQPSFVRGADVFVDDGGDVAGGERVQIDGIFDGDLVGIQWAIRTFSQLVAPANQLFSYVAVTVVVIPPRAEKSPTTVIRRGAQTATRSSRIWLVTAS